MCKTNILISFILMSLGILLALEPVHLGHKVLQLSSNANNQILACTFCILAALLVVHAIKHLNPLEAIGTFLYTISATGILLSSNLLTMLIMWELAALSAILLLAGNNNYGPILRYVVMHFIGGTCILAAIFYDPTMLREPLILSRQSLDSFSQSLLLIGILINCAALPFSAWLPDTYPTSAPHATTILQIYVTKSAAFILAMIFSGYELLIPIGLMTAGYAFIYSLWQHRLRSLLAYNTVGQMGLIITAIGCGTNVIPYLFISIIYQTILYMLASVVIHATGQEEFDHLGGLYKKMPYLAISGIIAVLTMAPFPFTNSFHAKALVSHHMDSKYVVILFTLLNVALLMSCGMRFIYHTFFGESRDTDAKYTTVSKYETITILLISSLCFIPIFDIPSAYSLLTISKQIVLCAVASIFFYSARHYKIIKTIPDIDYLYRVLMVNFLSRIYLLIEKSWQKIINALSCLLTVMLKKIDAIKIATIPFTVLLAMTVITILMVMKFILGSYE